MQCHWFCLVINSIKTVDIFQTSRRIRCSTFVFFLFLKLLILRNLKKKKTKRIGNIKYKEPRASSWIIEYVLVSSNQACSVSDSDDAAIIIDLFISSSWSCEFKRRLWIILACNAHMYPFCTVQQSLILQRGNYLLLSAGTKSWTCSM